MFTAPVNMSPKASTAPPARMAASFAFFSVTRALISVIRIPSIRVLIASNTPTSGVVMR